ncbi:MAG: patatin-like phospholipase family protein [Porphyrobacter sp.]|nr:patatin-like phospholipase family protein [Porphyrobacter sp.]
MRTAFLLLAAGLGLAGCATTPINVDCPSFRTKYSHPVPRSPTMEEIQSGAIPQGAALLDGRAELQASLEQTLGEAFVAETRHGPALLALSGGGQWGAFGAAFLEQLDANSPGGLPKFTVITGVSTGALQALYVGAAMAQPHGPDRAAVLSQLTTQYNPGSEREIVKRSSKYLAPFKGAVAKLGPLRRRIEAALCKSNAANPVEVADCPLIEQLAQPDAPTVLLGFVEVETGEMQYVNVTQIARDAVSPRNDDARIDIRTAQQCITGGALASVAMPFFYQQVQVTSASPEPAPKRPSKPVTYYDGGVRQSMFLIETRLALSELASAKGVLKSGEAEGPPIYLVRNGPTIALPDRNANNKRDALTTAERGYSLIVNQSEVMAIEAIRLREPKAEIRLVTADGYDKNFPDRGSKICAKIDTEAMFEPQFMRCLQEFGRHRAKIGDDGQAVGWITLSKPK